MKHYELWKIHEYAVSNAMQIDELLNIKVRPATFCSISRAVCMLSSLCVNRLPKAVVCINPFESGLFVLLPGPLQGSPR